VPSLLFLILFASIKKYAKNLVVTGIYFSSKNFFECDFLDHVGRFFRDNSKNFPNGFPKKSHPKNQSLSTTTASPKIVYAMS